MSELYSKLLATKGYGYPLWIPEPNENLPHEYRLRGVSIGDVGIITSDGEFDFLFNACLPPAHPINENNVPEGFVPFALKQQDITRQSHWHPPGTVISIGHLVSRGLNVEGTRSLPVGVDAAFKVEFTGEGGAVLYLSEGASREKLLGDLSSTIAKAHIGPTSSEPGDGAFLILPEGASREDLVDVDKLRDHGSQNAAAYYNFVNGRRERMDDDNSLLLVTGSDKAKCWEIASYSSPYNSTSSSGRVDYSVRSCSDSMQSRFGPIPPTDAENQCVFLRGLALSQDGDVNPVETLLTTKLKRPVVGQTLERLSSLPLQDIINSIPDWFVTSPSGQNIGVLDWSDNGWHEDDPEWLKIFTELSFLLHSTRPNQPLLANLRDFRAYCHTSDGVNAIAAWLSPSLNTIDITLGLDVDDRASTLFLSGVWDHCAQLTSFSLRMDHRTSNPRLYTVHALLVLLRSLKAAKQVTVPLYVALGQHLAALAGLIVLDLGMEVEVEVRVEVEEVETSTLTPGSCGMVVRKEFGAPNNILGWGSPLLLCDKSTKNRVSSSLPFPCIHFLTIAGFLSDITTIIRSTYTLERLSLTTECIRHPDEMIRAMQDITKCCPGPAFLDFDIYMLVGDHGGQGRDQGKKDGLNDEVWRLVETCWVHNMTELPSNQTVDQSRALPDRGPLAPIQFGA